MANLNFKWGTYANLPETKVEGTVYVTTDERSMYIDVPKGESTERIRVQGSVLYYDSVEAFTATTNPPYAQDTLYFFRKLKSGDDQVANAIMAYDGTKWVQINTPKQTYDELEKSLLTLSGDVTTLSNSLTKLTGRVDKAEEDIATNAADIAILQGLVGIDASGGNSLSKRLEAVETLAEKNKDDIASNDGDITTLQNNVTTLQNDKADASELNKKLDIETYTVDKATFATIDKLDEELAKKVNKDDYTKDKAIIENNISSLQSNKADASAVSDALKAKLDAATYAQDKDSFATKTKMNEELAKKVDSASYASDKATIENNISTLSTNKADKSEITNLNTALTNKINNDIKAVNALEYKGNISAYSELPSGTDVKIGHMYVATQVFNTNNDVSVAPGDLFIASGVENDNGFISGDITWNHVKTGYDTLLNPYLKLDSNAITLYNYAHNSLGSISLISDNDNIKLNSATDEDGNQTITLSNTWGTF